MKCYPFLFDPKSRTRQKNIEYDNIELIDSEELSDDYFTNNVDTQSMSEKLIKGTKVSKKIKNKDFYKNLNAKLMNYVDEIDLVPLGKKI